MAKHNSGESRADAWNVAKRVARLEILKGQKQSRPIVMAGPSSPASRDTAEAGPLGPLGRAQPVGNRALRARLIVIRCVQIGRGRPHRALRSRTLPGSRPSAAVRLVRRRRSHSVGRPRRRNGPANTPTTSLLGRRRVCSGHETQSDRRHTPPSPGKRFCRTARERSPQVFP